MNKRTLKTIALTLAIALCPMANVQAMDTNIVKKEKTKDLIEVVGTDLAKQALASAIILPAMSYASMAAHEAGHALVASAIKPGCVEKIDIGIVSGYVWFDDTSMSPLQKIAIYAAGPIAGGAFSYGCAKAALALNKHFKQDAITKALNGQPTHASNALPAINAFGNLADLLVKTQTNNLQTSTPNTDGSQILREVATLYNLSITANVGVTGATSIAVGALQHLYDKHFSYEKGNETQSIHDAKNKKVSFIDSESHLPPAYGTIGKTLKRLLL